MREIFFFVACNLFVLVRTKKNFQFIRRGNGNRVKGCLCSLFERLQRRMNSEEETVDKKIERECIWTGQEGGGDGGGGEITSERGCIEHAELTCLYLNELHMFMCIGILQIKTCSMHQPCTEAHTGEERREERMEHRKTCLASSIRQSQNTGKNIILTWNEFCCVFFDSFSFLRRSCYSIRLTLSRWTTHRSNVFKLFLCIYSIPIRFIHLWDDIDDINDWNGNRSLIDCVHFSLSLQEVGSIIGKKGEIVNRFREEVSEAIYIASLKFIPIWPFVGSTGRYRLCPCRSFVNWTTDSD